MLKDHFNTENRIRELLEASGRSAAALARHAGVTPQAAAHWLKGKTSPRKKTLEKVAEFLEICPAQLLFDDIDEARASLRNRVEIEKKTDILKTWVLQHLGHSHADIRAVTARGSAMSGTIEDGDILFVDSSVRQYGHPGIYVLGTGAGMQIKRLQKMRDGKLAVISDNKAFETEYLEGEAVSSIRISGRVLGSIALKKF